MRDRDGRRRRARKLQSSAPPGPAVLESAEVRRLKKALMLSRLENDRPGGQAVAQLSSENARLRSMIEDHQLASKRAKAVLTSAIIQGDLCDDERRDMIVRAIGFLSEPNDGSSRHLTAPRRAHPRSNGRGEGEGEGVQSRRSE